MMALILFGVLLISGAPVALDRIGEGSAFLIKPFRSQVFLSKIVDLVAPTA